MKWFSADHHPDNRGEKNPAYKGDEAKYAAIHTWVRRRNHKPVRCELCGGIKKWLDLAL